MLDTRPLLIETDFPALERGALSTLQVNLGYLCNSPVLTVTSMPAHDARN